jgi:ADP-heptose:LPS heptosyltransferase
LKVLIVRTDRIGDTLLTLPLAVHLKKKIKDAEIIFLCRSYTKDLVQLCNSVDKIIAIDEQNFFDTISLLLKEKIDVGIHVNPRFSSALILWLAGIKIIVGTKYRAYSILFNRWVPLHRKYSIKHELEYNFDLLSGINLETNIDLFDVDFGVRINDCKKQLTITKLKNKGIDLTRKNVILHVGSSGSAIDWNKKNFFELAVMISKKYNCNIILTGSSEESEILNDLFREYTDKIFNLAGTLNLEELFNLLTIADVYIGNSTGPTHLAAVAGTNVIAFYPKIPSCSVLRWGPVTKKRIIFEPKIDCSNCNENQCKELNCMDSICIEEVFEKVETFLV